jgi:hypothetical protein
MKIVHAIRSEIYPILGSSFKKMKINPRIVEVGVCKGKNLEDLINTLDPESSTLIDQWIPYSPFKDAPVGSELYNTTSRYFGGPVDDPQTYENLYQYCYEKFIKDTNNRIIRKDSISAAEDLLIENKKFDFIYIDGGHLYEEVYNDLVHYEKLLNDNGVIMLDDFINSKEGELQNLGVVVAVVDFLKKFNNYQPVLITRSTSKSWCNIVISKKESVINHLIDSSLLESEIFFVEIEDSNIHLIKNSPKENCIRFNQ